MKEDWVECTFEDIIIIVSGKNQKNVINENGEYPIYGSGGIIGRANDYLCEPGTTIIGRKGTINSPIYVKERFWNVDTAFGFQPYKILDNRLLYFFCVFFNFKNLDKSTTIPSLAKRDLLKIKFSLPPATEQQAIVKKIEGLLSSLDHSVESLTKAQEQLKIYRQAVLKKAFEGELTKEWRKKEKTFKKEWKRKKLGSVLNTIDGDRGKNYPKKSEFSNKGYCLFLSTKNVRFGQFVFEDNQFISKEKDNLLKGGKLHRNDVVITTRGTLGNVALYDDKVKFKNVRINSGMLILRVNSSKELIQTYLMQFINSPIFIKQLKTLQSGTAQPQIPARVLREIEIEIPNKVSEQYQIVKEIESRLSVCDKLEESIVTSLQKAKALRQSILKKAFEGTLLTPQEIAACKAAPNYEPASVLLEKIKAEKAAKTTAEKKPEKQVTK